MRKVIEDFCARYPLTLNSLVDSWWENESVFETLCAFATWRRSIDEAGDHPQQEIEFQAYLSEFESKLHRDAGLRLTPRPSHPTSPRARGRLLRGALPSRASNTLGVGTPSRLMVRTQPAT